ncbi:helix-turn-helix domain-containing protein [Chloroflexota bacterium]
MLQRERKIKTLNTDKVAWLLGTDSKTVLRWASAGIIKSCRTTCQGDRLFRRGDVVDLLTKLGA